VRNWTSDLAVRVGPPVLRALGRSWRFTEVSPTDGSLGPPVRRLVPELYVLWHQQLLMLTLRHPEEKVTVMISRSRDGDVATRVVEQLGLCVVRGSSSRGGSIGLREMLKATGAGHPLALTVDGPRGPARKCKPGAILIAARAGVPIVPTVAIPVHARALNSWDRFLVPAPRSNIFVSYGEPIRVQTDSSPEDLGMWQCQVDTEMERLVGMCEDAAGTSWPRTRDG